MQVQQKQLKPLSSIELTGDEAIILKWIRSVKWEAQTAMKEPIAYKAKIPEFFNGVRMYKVQGGATSGAGAMGAVDLLIKKIEFQGVISKQDLYPVVTQGTARFLMLKQAELDNLGVRASSDDEDDE